MAPSATLSPADQLTLNPAAKASSSSSSPSPAAVAYQQLEASYSAQNPKSQSLYDQALKSLPGGNTRSVLFYPPFPLSVVRAEGRKLYDADGHEYIDLLGEYSAGLYGHSHPEILSAITSALSQGLSFGSHHADEFRLAELVKARFPSMELLRFTNSGTESNLMAVAVAKIFTGRSKILVFYGGYHGGVFLFAEGNSSVNVPHEFLIAKYNDISSVRDLLDEHGHDTAAILVEPMIGSGGGFQGTKEFLQFLKTKSADVGALLIFDEIMTSRFYDGGGVQGEFSIKPDLTTLGKYIGGGMSIGAFGGRADIMALFDPRTGTIPHAGTFNNNVLTMAAGRAGLEKVFTPTKARELHERGENLRARLNEVGAGTKMKVMGCGSIVVFHFTDTDVADISCSQDLQGVRKDLGDLLHLYLLEHRYYIARRGYLSLSLLVEDGDLDSFVAVVKSFVSEYRDIL